MTGIRFHFPANLGISVDDRIEVKFILDDPQKTNIHKEIRILNSANGQYGGEFLNLANEEKRLGYYLFLLGRGTPLGVTGNRKNVKSLLFLNG
jgi:hypothetical protein